MKKYSKAILSVLVAGSTVAAPLLAFADEQVRVTGTTNVTTGTDSSKHTDLEDSLKIHQELHASTTMASSTKKEEHTQDKMDKGAARGDKELTKRIASLNAFLTRVNAMQRLSSSVKASIAATVQAEISTLTSLKAKIDADTDTATLKADVQSVTKAYRVYALVMPQETILAASDRVQTLTGMMMTLKGKLDTRISTAASAGVNVTAAQAASADIAVKIADANTQAAAAASEVASLKPDNGDKTIFASNQSTLKDARAKLKVAEQDMKAARVDVKTILGIVKGHGEITASTTASH